jgi:hypothetical protein
MRTLPRHAAVLGAISSAVSTAACSECPDVDVDRTDTKQVDAAVLCEIVREARAGKTSGRLRIQAAADPSPGANNYFACDRICGNEYNLCSIEPRYAQALAQSTADGGPSACPSITGPVTVTCQILDHDPVLTPGSCPVYVGRRPDGLSPAKRRQSSALAQFFADNAHLEAAAVLAFDHMILELVAHGAPGPLVRAARAARQDEARHAAVTDALARRFGARPPPALATAMPIRTLSEMALENEVEGVVRETFGAAVASFRAERAGDPALRAALAEIARDEAEHAVLSRALGGWFRGRLSAGDHDRLDLARAEAIVDLRRSITANPHADVRLVAGEPLAVEMRTMIDALERSSWTIARRA